MIASVSEEIVCAADENRIIISPIPIGQPVFVIEKCKCGLLYAKRCRRTVGLYCEPLGADSRDFHCAAVYMRTFDYIMHSKKLGKTVFEKKMDALLAVKAMVQKQQH